jgi:molybdopterin-binding protein
VEVITDIGFEISAMVTQKSIRRLDLEIGNQTYISFKANAARFIPKNEKAIASKANR